MEVEDTLVDDCDNNRTLVMKTPGDRKITVGFVVQVYNDKGKCIEQEFVAGDQVDWENEDERFIPTPVHDYQPFDMVQPQKSGEVTVIGAMGENGQVKFNDVTCKFCHKQVPANTAHAHQGGFVGECCWDERLRSSE